MVDAPAPDASRRSSRISPNAPTASDRWPCSGRRCTRAPGMWAASHSPWAIGTIRSCRPCQTEIGTRDPSEVEPPIAHEREVVVEPSPRPVAEGRAQRGGEVVAELAGDLLGIDARQQRPPLGDDLIRLDRRHRLDVRLHPPEQLVGVAGRGRVLDLVVLAHPGGPVEPLGVVRGHAGDRRGGPHAVREQRRAREGVRAAARPPGREEPLVAEVVGERGDVRRRARDRPPSCRWTPRTRRARGTRGRCRALRRRDGTARTAVPTPGLP